MDIKLSRNIHTQYWNMFPWITGFFFLFETAFLVFRLGFGTRACEHGVKDPWLNYHYFLLLSSFIIGHSWEKEMKKEMKERKKPMDDRTNTKKERAKQKNNETNKHTRVTRMYRYVRNIRISEFRFLFFLSSLFFPQDKLRRYYRFFCQWLTSYDGSKKILNLTVWGIKLSWCQSRI